MPDTPKVQISIMVPTELQSTLVAVASGVTSDPADWAANALESNYRLPTCATPTCSNDDPQVALNMRLSRDVEQALRKEAKQRNTTFSRVAIEKIRNAVNHQGKGCR